MTKKILITGATDGIGLLTANKFAALGHTLLIHGRNPEKLQAAKEQLIAAGAAAVICYQADLSDFSETRALIKQIQSEHSQLDVLINNAGIYKTNQPITKDNLDVRFVVNTLAPYLITTELKPLLNNNSRVVNLSSAAQAPVDLDALAGKFPLEDQFSAYAQSKLAITMWSRYLADHWQADSSQQTPVIIAVNPASLLASKMVKEGFGVAGKDMNIGADILVDLALKPEYQTHSSEYFDNDIGQFTAPHPAGEDEHNRNELIAAMENLL
ncbi:SDR family NAD(P)-dependent oxidoreductase [Bacterioplanoides sp.]|uniref:SDR family NAD(P)-dependent oxidoreductase n=1 Tax=Bacterioplanoides sp. TaxID=2066072 RepID=UPI003B5C6358